ncbi:MAG: class I SAM-dependent methyltransferase [Anaerolineae bacterium]
MNKEVTERLLALNREFYAAFARPFAASRVVCDPAMTCILPYIPQHARVLDVGCGNGRLALLLDRERPGVTYLGLDAVPELVELARAQADQLTNISAEFRVADITQPGWSDPHKLDIVHCPLVIDTAVALAVLHHIPGFDLRVRVLREIATMLAPNGCLILSTWQFLENERMRRKIVDWAEVGVVEEALEPGDYLLDWKREGQGLRYCHLVDEAEVRQLAGASGLRVSQTFRAGGRERNLSLFAVLESLPV